MILEPNKLVPLNLLLFRLDIIPHNCSRIEIPWKRPYLNTIFLLHELVNNVPELKQFSLTPAAVIQSWNLPYASSFQDVSFNTSNPYRTSFKKDKLNILQHTNLVPSKNVFKTKSSFRLKEANGLSSNSRPLSFFQKKNWIKLINLFEHMFWQNKVPTPVFLQVKQH